MMIKSKGKTKTGISVIVPVYNSEATLNELHKHLVTALGKITADFEIIGVDDGSRDGSWSVLEQIAATDNRVTGLQLSKNFGQHNALLCGIRRARYDTIVTIDDDLQNPPEEIAKLIGRLDDNTDVVYGISPKPHHSLFRNLSSQITKIILQNAMDAQTARNISAFRAFRREICENFKDYRGSYINIDVLLTWGTTRFGNVVVKHDERKAGRSNYTLGKLIVHSVNMFTGFSTIPLQVASIIGFIFTLFGIGALIYVVGKWIVLGSVVPGFAFLASVVIIFSGAQLFALGIIGEYLARIHFRTMDKPIYNIRTTTIAAHSQETNIQY